ncbi:ATP-dependent DNA helicase RecQ [Flavobacterium filum]|uniref:RecQ family ATP-dependent DNA helicase n=2 Tax=Flavobacteriaceae TaxID=49546 RepID=UPI00042025D0|nr:ATP-dependent DNA helicase RecQ [Flavobacterium filum]
MQKPEEILKKYWGYSSFREPQLDIIQSVLDGKDTIGLLPTGGGKSVCFQVPAMMNDGICLVISPLVALMKDQVDQLKKRDIKAVALTGGISVDDITTLFDNCLYGNYKFLYLSPERLEQDWIIEKIKNLPVNLIAIDEAHCISQWGHDFRPSYLKVNVLKQHFPGVPFLALTATATQRVKQDIIEQLNLEKPQLFQKSFARENLSYHVIPSEDKLYQITQILNRQPEPSIIYVRNRKNCVEIAEQLSKLGFKANFYHGGLTMREKTKNMEDWMTEKTPIMVATNAFGMGIDKANVRTVIHFQLPDNLENYYQEAGRAGRNGEMAQAILLLGPNDCNQVQSQLNNSLPDKEYLKSVFTKLCNYFQIAYGEGIDDEFSFNLNHFCIQYQLPVVKTYNALIFLNNQGIIHFSQEFSEKVLLQFIIESKEVIRYISLHRHQEEIILTILRTYSGIYDTTTAINVSLIAKKSGVSESDVEDVLSQLHQKGIVSYAAKSNDSKITFLEVREDDRTLSRTFKYLTSQNELKTAQLSSVINYVSDTKTCKSVLLLQYFGEKNVKNCGHCSSCKSSKALTSENDKLKDKIIYLLTERELSSRELQQIVLAEDEPLLQAIRELLDEQKIIVLPNNKFKSKQ